MQNDEKCVGYIQLVYLDQSSGEVITVGGAGFLTKDEDDAAWGNIPTHPEETDFMADRMDADRNIVDDKWVSAQTCERLMGAPIAQLIAEGRAKLDAELAAYRPRWVAPPARESGHA